MTWAEFVASLESQIKKFLYNKTLQKGEDRAKRLEQSFAKDGSMKVRFSEDELKTLACRYFGQSNVENAETDYNRWPVDSKALLEVNANISHINWFRVCFLVDVKILKICDIKLSNDVAKI